MSEFKSEAFEVWALTEADSEVEKCFRVDVKNYVIASASILLEALQMKSRMEYMVVFE